MKYRRIVHSKNKLTTHVLLATAVVKVKNKFNQYVPCRMLLDSASQVNFITERCVQRLKLARHQSATSIQGINNVNTATHHSVSIHLRSRRTDWHTSLTCAVLPSITSSPATKLDTTTWNLPSDILLADEHFDRPSAIDLLIGADLFYEILLSNQRTRKGYPFLQETVLGWIVSGTTPAVSSSSSNNAISGCTKPQHNGRRGCTKPQDDVKESDCSTACTTTNSSTACTKRSSTACTIRRQHKKWMH